MTALTISTVIPVYEGERHLAESIQSVLDQTRPPLEVIVIDDGSTDGSLNVATGFGDPVRPVRILHAGISAARNAGLAEVRGDVVTFLDSDDLWAPTALGALAGALESGPADIAFGHVRQFVSPGEDLTDAERRWYHRGFEPGYIVGAAAIRREALVAVGGFREDLRTGEFIDWIARARDLGLRETLIAEHVLDRRIHQGNHGRLRKEARTDYTRALKSALDRRRAS
jgi:glycosyltransferase involved in cell wall biosynthesis